MYALGSDGIGGSVFTINGSGGLGAFSGDLPAACSGDPSGCRATEAIFDRVKAAFEKAGWPQPLSQAFVAADNAWQALKERAASISPQEQADTQRTLKALETQLATTAAAVAASKKGGSSKGGSAAAPPPAAVASSGGGIMDYLSGVPRWAWYAAGGAAVLGAVGMVMSRRAAKPAAIQGWRRSARRR